jgi:folate-dependent phosphoribosylglycinamide formyltransferase PurN
MKISIVTFDDPFAALVLSGLFNSKEIKIDSVYLSKEQFYNKSIYEVIKSSVKRSGYYYFVVKALEFYLAKFSLLVRNIFGINRVSDYKVKSLGSWMKEKGIKPKICEDANSENFRNELKKRKVDLVFSVRFNQIIGEKTLEVPRYGFVNFHNSLLPKHKGLAPELRAFIHKDKFIGFSIHKMSKKIDEGEILLQHRIPIKKDDSVARTSLKCHLIGGMKLPGVLKSYMSGKLEGKKQEKGGNYGSWPKREEINNFKKLEKNYLKISDFIDLAFKKWKK